MTEQKGAEQDAGYEEGPTVLDRFDLAAAALADARDAWDRGLSQQCADACRKAAGLAVQLFLDAQPLLPAGVYEAFGKEHAQEMKTALMAGGSAEDLHPMMDRVYRISRAVEELLEEHGLLRD